MIALVAPCSAPGSRRHSSRQEPNCLLECLLVTMPNKTSGENRVELLQGTLDMMILRTLRWGPQHGHGVGQAIRASSQDVLQVERGSIYPALHRLERQGWIESEWKITENKQRAKYYRLTRTGRKQLVSEESRWNRLLKAGRHAMRPA